MTGQTYFTDDLFRFLRKLKRNNNRDWFHAHRHDYETCAREPMLRLLKDFKPVFETIAPQYVCDHRSNGGSMFRIHRDMRFVDPEEGPYKTHVSAQFRHKKGKDIHAPGFYLHLEPGSCFFAGGLWRPPTIARNRVHAAIANDPGKWLKIKNSKSFARYFAADEGKMLKRPSHFYRETLPKEIADDLRRNDFLFSIDLDQRLVTSPSLIRELTQMTKIAADFMNFLCVSVT